MSRSRNILTDIDWLTVGVYLALVITGILSMYSVSYDGEQLNGIGELFDLDKSYGRQLMWLGVSLGAAVVLMLLDSKFYITFSYIVYGAIVGLLVYVLLFGATINGSKSWIKLGAFSLQPAEFAKFATSLAMAKFLSTLNVSLKSRRTKLISLAIIGLPALLVLAQGDMGSTLVYSSFIIMLYREGLEPIFPIMGISAIALFVLALLVPKFILLGVLVGLTLLVLLAMRKQLKRVLWPVIGVAVVCIVVVFSVDFAFNNVLKQHQQDRIMVMLGQEVGEGVSYNLDQSKIAIGSGGFWGKGYLNGTQTKGGFVPEQSTDFIFCTIGEERGFFGSFILIALFVALISRVLFIAERQRSDFGRIYGYCVAGIFFFHFMINVGMTIGLAPVVGIPLPFISYGGSSLLAFSILLFILLRLDAQRMLVWR